MLRRRPPSLRSLGLAQHWPGLKIRLDEHPRDLTRSFLFQPASPQGARLKMAAYGEVRGNWLQRVLALPIERRQIQPATLGWPLAFSSLVSVDFVQ